MRTLFCGVFFFTLLTLTSCYDPHARDSRIVREVEAAGAGDLTLVNSQGLIRWFGLRPALARKVSAECTPLSHAAPANWDMTAEGTVCHAAVIAQAWQAPNITADKRTW